MRGRPRRHCHDNEQLRAMHEAGLSTYRIAERMGATHILVKKWLAAAGLEYAPKQKKRAPDELKWATILFAPGLGKRVQPKLYMAWDNMKKRCAGRPKYHVSYGSKGIKVCDEWRDSYATFRSWAIANGFRKGLSLDRIDNDGNYEPANCRWTTPFVQSVNSRRTHILTLGGVTKPLPIWARDLDMPIDLLRSRKHQGWTDEQILTTPPLTPGQWREGVQHKKRGRRAAN
jgi:hypothetical protein